MRAVSQDGRWVVDGLENTRVTARDAKSHGKAIEFRGVEPVYAVDISPGTTEVATGSDVAAVKFSPDRHFIAIWTHAPSKQPDDRRLGPFKVLEKAGQRAY